MPNYSKPLRNGKPAAGKAPYAGADRSASKPGSRSPKHRGFRAEEAAVAAPKKRWNADERSARRDAPATDGRPNWEPREKQARPNDERPQRGSYGQRTERTARRDYNSDAPKRDYSAGAPRRDDRPRRDDAAPRREYNADRPKRDFADRPRRDDAAPRREYNTDRPRRDDAAPRREYNADRPKRDFADRPRRDDAAPSREYNADRPKRDFADRPRRDDAAPRREYNAERPARREYTDERPARRDSSYYPDRDANKSHSGGGHVEDVVLEKLEAAVTTAGDVEGVSFIDLGIGANISRQLAEMGAASPFPIQAATIPDVLAGKDVLGRGRTGSGKTIAFGAPLVERLMENNGAKDRKIGRLPRALILAPTRELAQQIDRTIQPIARSVGLFTVTIVGGVPQYKQVAGLQRGVDIVIATPGRVEDLVEQGRLDLSNVIVTVLDEADHMCDLGFLEPVQRIIRETNPDGQKLLFSATLDKGVATLVNEFLVDPAVHEVAGEDQASSTIDHRMLLLEQRDKREVIRQLASGEGKTLVFTRTRAFAEEMSDYLEDAGIASTSLHGDLNQARRNRNLQLLTSGRVNVLVATDVAARGIHVDDISLVIQADAPEEYKTYLHRSGRTGRAGKKGTVVTLVPKNRRRKMDELLGRAEIDPEVSTVAPGDALLDELAAL